MIRAKLLIEPRSLVTNLLSYKVLDATWLMPNLKRNARAEYDAEHIVGARFFDLDDISDKSSPYPHTLPTAEVFATKIGELGIENSDHVVIYDTLGLFSAARCWYMFRGFGHEAVSILNGGLRGWKAVGGPVTSEPTPITPAKYTAQPFNRDLLRTYEDIIANERSARELVVDARPAPRFELQVDEPRAGLPRGRIEHSVNVPAASIVDSEGRVRSDGELSALFRKAGVDGSKPVVVSCGSGVTACVTGFAALLSGVVSQPPPLYDGAYTEYAMRKAAEQNADVAAAVKAPTVSSEAAR